MTESDEVRVGDRFEVMKDTRIFLQRGGEEMWRGGDGVEAVAEDPTHGRGKYVWKNHRTGNLAAGGLDPAYSKWHRLPREQTIEERRASLKAGDVIKEPELLCEWMRLLGFGREVTLLKRHVDYWATVDGQYNVLDDVIADGYWSFLSLPSKPAVRETHASDGHGGVWCGKGAPGGVLEVSHEWDGTTCIPCLEAGLRHDTCYPARADAINDRLTKLRGAPAPVAEPPKPVPLPFRYVDHCLEAKRHDGKTMCLECETRVANMTAYLEATLHEERESPPRPSVGPPEPLRSGWGAMDWRVTRWR